MSKAEIMATARGLKEEERLFLAAFLKHLSRVDSPEYKKHLSELDEEFADGKTFSQEQVERLDRQLSEEGL